MSTTLPPDDFVPGIEPVEGDFEREPGAVLEPEFKIAFDGHRGAFSPTAKFAGARPTASGCPRPRS